MITARRLRERLPSGDAGTSLMELVAGMAVLTVFMGIFTGAIVGMGQTINRVEAVTTSSAQTNNAFLRLDKLVRYSAAVTVASNLTSSGAPTSSGDWYVELDAVDGMTNVETCTQLRVDIALQQLQQRSWVATGPTSYASVSKWTMIADNITNGTVAMGDANQPFSAPPALAAASTSLQRLQVTLVAATAGATSSTTTRATMTFNALNSVASSTTNSAKCQQLGSAVGRP